MKRSSKKREKKYRPKGLTAYGGLHVIAGRVVAQNPLPDHQQQDIKIDYYNAIDAMIGGWAEQKHFDVLVYAVNIGRVLVEHDIGAEYTELVDRAALAMLRCKERWQRTGKFGLAGDELQALRDMGPLHEAQIEVATAGELEQAIAEMHRRNAAGQVLEGAPA